MPELLKGRPAIALALLLTVLIVSNIGFAYSHGWSRWEWQLGGFIGLAAVYFLSGMSLEDIGLSRSTLVSGLKYGLLAMLAIGLVLAVVFFVDSTIFKDNRYNQGLAAALTAGFIVLPLKVILFEELAFRGLMPALLKDLGSKPLVIFVVTAVLFGLWHLLTAPRPGSSSVAGNASLLIIVGVFVATSVAGLAFYWLRQQSGSLVAPILAHWFINSSAMILAALSWMKH